MTISLASNPAEGIWLGRLKHTKDKYENITWTNEPIKSLGVYFGYNKTQCDQLNSSGAERACHLDCEVPYGRGSAEGPQKPWDKWCKILHSGHFLAAKLAIQKL
jgi:hypothetical protein